MATAKTPQTKRLNELAAQGVRQTNVLVHEKNRQSLDALRPYLRDPYQEQALFELTAQLAVAPPVNVAQVKQLSPFRYPGGKTWLVPLAKEWANSLTHQPKKLLEPFAGGAMISLSLVANGLVDHAHLVELDEDVAAVWEIIINSTDNDVFQLTQRITDFEVTLENVRKIIDADSSELSAVELAFRTIVKNRTQRGGIMAPGAGLVKVGEGGKGLASRWYPTTLVKRINAIRQIREGLSFTQGDALEAIENNPGSILFVDPPYTAGGKKAGSRLYRYSEVDHEKLFELIEANPAPALITYDDSEEVRALVEQHGFSLTGVNMKSTHHAVLKELCIFKND